MKTTDIEIRIVRWERAQKGYSLFLVGYRRTLDCKHAIQNSSHVRAIKCKSYILHSLWQVQAISALSIESMWDDSSRTILRTTASYEGADSFIIKVLLIRRCRGQQDKIKDIANVSIEARSSRSSGIVYTLRPDRFVITFSGVRTGQWLWHLLEGKLCCSSPKTA
jgi:hypothetical protein